ncbi:MAG: hypothetical protein ACYC61_05970 [Isosphaeraceae bacterium]
MANEIADACRASGLRTATNAELPPGRDTSDALWEALAESRALVVIPPRSGLTASMWIEVGAVRAWNKPIFGILADPSIHPPPALSSIPFYVPARMDELINAIQSVGRGITEADASILIEIYQEIGESVDQLMVDPKLRQRLVRQFKTRAKKSVTEEQLLSELLRIRKKGRLKLGRPAPKMKPSVGSA